MALLDGPLDLLGMVVAAVGDDQVLLPPHDIDLVLGGEAEVTRPQERAFAGVRDLRPEGFGGSLRPLPIAAAERAMGDPDLADLPFRLGRAALGIDDAHRGTRDGAAAA